ncbi:MAG: NlpC/P60 family protein [Lachnospiraceae bacterium]
MKNWKKAALVLSFCLLYASGISMPALINSDTDAQQIPQAVISKKLAPNVSVQAGGYENVAVSQVSGYVNVRSEASTNGQIVGKIYNNCAATITETVSGEGGTWYRIQSGSVTGYVKAQYFVTGAAAEALAKEVGVEYATINTASLRLRKEPNLTSETLTLLSQGARYEVLGTENNFAKLAVDTDLTGYVSMDYIKTAVEFQQAVSLEEEAAKQAEEERRRQEAEAAINELNAVLNAETAGGSQSQTNNSSGQSATTAVGVNGTIAANPMGSGNDVSARVPVLQTQGTPAKSGNSSSQGNSGATVPAGPGGSGSSGAGNIQGPGVSYGPGGNASDKVVSATRTAVVAYAKQFLGNPYVYGGTSLTDGADCSGFTMSIYKHFGIDIGRTSRDQADKGREISQSEMQPGDLLFYASGDYINHVSMYVGGGQVIHSSTPATGITLAPVDYRTPCKIVTFLD